MNWEISILQLLESARGQTLNTLFEIITSTAESAFLLGVIAIVYWCINKKLGLKLGFVMLFSSVINGMIKNLVKASRPFELGVIEPLRKHTATGYSFPSGHTQGATTFWVMCIIYVKKRWLYYLGLTMIILVALSRLYLGVHWPVDVMAAMVIGTVSTIIGQYVFEKIETLGAPGLLFSCILIGSTLLLKFDHDYIKVVGAIIGLIIGLMLECRYVSFTTKGLLKFQIYKVVIGLLGLVAIAGGLKFVLPQLVIFDCLRYMFIVIWIIAGAPYVFVKQTKE